MSFLSQLASELTTAAADIVKNKTELEKKLDEALSKANWGASSSLLRDIAKHTHYPYDFPVIMKAVWGALNHSGKNWRQIYKGLVLLEALVKFGAERCVDEARAHIFRVRTLQEFSYYDGPKDQGAGIREISKRLVDLLAEDARLRDERKKARELSSNVIGITNQGINYSGFGSGSDSGFNPSFAGHNVQAITAGGGGRGRYQSQDEEDKTWADAGDFSGFGSGTTTRGQGRQPAGRRVGRRGSTESSGGGKAASGRRQSLVQDAAADFEPFSIDQDVTQKDDAFDFFGPQSSAHVARPAQPVKAPTAIQAPTFDTSDFDSFGPPVAAMPVKTTSPAVTAPRRPSRVSQTPAFPSFDAFGTTAASTQAATLAPAAAPVSAVNVLDDIFSAGPSTSSTAAAVNNDFFLSAPATSQLVASSDPFGGDVFGSFASSTTVPTSVMQQTQVTSPSAVTADNDINRLVSLDPFNFSSTTTPVTQTPAKPTASLATLMGSVGNKKSNVMQNNATVSMAIDYSIGSTMSPGMKNNMQPMSMQNMGMGMGMQNMGMNMQPNMGMSMGMGMQPNMGMQSMGMGMQPNMGMQSMGMGMQPNMGMQSMGMQQQQFPNPNVKSDPFGSFF